MQVLLEALQGSRFAQRCGGCPGPFLRMPTLRHGGATRTAGGGCYGRAGASPNGATMTSRCAAACSPSARFRQSSVHARRRPVWGTPLLKHTHMTLAADKHRPGGGLCPFGALRRLHEWPDIRPAVDGHCGLGGAQAERARTGAQVCRCAFEPANRPVAWQ
eukprot:365630-Chlamydomonas_euryale.AAC.26